MHIRPATPEDRPALDALVAAVFGEEGGAVVSVMHALAASGAVRASLLAEDDGEAVGHVMLSRGWIDARERLVDALVLSPLSVRPDRQRAGLGTALLRAALAAAEGLAAPAVFLEGGWDYYGERGFERASGHGFERPSTRIPDRAFQVALLPAHEPWMTGRLVYPEAFWTTDTVGLRDPFLAEVEARD